MADKDEKRKHTLWWILAFVVAIILLIIFIDVEPQSAEQEIEDDPIGMVEPIPVKFIKSYVRV